MYSSGYEMRGIFGALVIIQVDQARHRIENHVFEDRAETLRAGMDLRFSRRGKFNDLRITAAFKIEHAVIAPAMLVVTDQTAPRIGRQRGLAGARETEEQGNIALLADIGRAVHCHHAFERQQIIQNREDGLLDFATVAGAADDTQTLLKIERNEGVGRGAINLGA